MDGLQVLDIYATRLVKSAKVEVEKAKIHAHQTAHITFIYVLT